MYIDTSVYKYVCVHTYVYAHIYVTLIYFSWTVKTASYRAIKNKLHLHQCLTYHRYTTEGTRDCSFIHLLSKPPSDNASLTKILKIMGLIRTPSAWCWFYFCWQLRSLLLPVFFENGHTEGSVLLCEKCLAEYWLLSLNSDGSAGLPLLLTLNFKCVLSPKMIYLFFCNSFLTNPQENKILDGAGKWGHLFLRVTYISSFVKHCSIYSNTVFSNKNIQWNVWSLPWFCFLFHRNKLLFCV